MLSLVEVNIGRPQVGPENANYPQCQRCGSHAEPVWGRCKRCEHLSGLDLAKLRIANKRFLAKRVKLGFIFIAIALALLVAEVIFLVSY